jgi:hypothetical protein
VEIDFPPSDPDGFAERREVEQEIGHDRQPGRHGIVDPDADLDQDEPTVEEYAAERKSGNRFNERRLVTV